MPTIGTGSQMIKDSDDYVPVDTLKQVPAYFFVNKCESDISDRKIKPKQVSIPAKLGIVSNCYEMSFTSLTCKEGGTCKPRHDEPRVSVPFSTPILKMLRHLCNDQDLDFDDDFKTAFEWARTDIA